MTIQINSVMAKICHAEDNLNSIENEVKSWMNGDNYSRSVQKNSDFTRHSVLFNIKDIPAHERTLKRWSLITGDIIHNLRCALDHLVYAIAVHQSGQRTPPFENRLMFPICELGTKFRDESKRKLGALSPPARAIIESVQPYNRPHPTLPPLLSILRNFSNTDKHRLLNLTFAATQFGDIGFAGHATRDIRGQFVINGGELKHGGEIAAFVFDSPAPDMEYDRIELQIVTALWHGKAHDSSSLFNERSEFITLIRAIKDEIKDVIEIITKSI